MDNLDNLAKNALDSLVKGAEGRGAAKRLLRAEGKALGEIAGELGNKAAELDESDTLEAARTTGQAAQFAMSLVRNPFEQEETQITKKEMEKSLDRLMAKYQKEQDTLKRDSESISINPLNLQHVKNQTLELCFCAVHNDGMALEFVREQTPQICAEAIRNNPQAIKFVHEQTENLCLQAVKRDGLALRHVRNPSLSVCQEAVRNNIHAAKLVPQQFIEQFADAIAKSNAILQQRTSIFRDFGVDRGR